MPREVTMRAEDLRGALDALGLRPRHAYHRRGQWVVIAGSRSATGSSIEEAFAELLATHSTVSA